MNTSFFTATSSFQNPSSKFLIVFTVYMTYFRNSGLKVMENWAKNKGYEILSSEFRWVKTGPYFLSGTSTHQRIFYVTLVDADGNQKNAWVRVGGFFLGLFSDEIDVKWVAK